MARKTKPIIRRLATKTGKWINRQVERYDAWCDKYDEEERQRKEYEDAAREQERKAEEDGVA